MLGALQSVMEGFAAEADAVGSRDILGLELQDGARKRADAHRLDEAASRPRGR